MLFTNHLPLMALVFGVTALLSAALTLLVRREALRRGLLDRPGEERRVHTRPVPRLGGLAMFAAFAVGVLLMFVFDVYSVGLPAGATALAGNTIYEPWRILFVVGGAGIITLVMAVDDVRGLSPVTRLIWQVGVALLVVVPSFLWPGGPNSGEPVGTQHFDQGAGVLVVSIQNPFGGAIELPILLAALFTTFWLVGVTNTINWIDGLDGLAAGVTVVACAVLFTITGPVLGQWTLSYLPLALGAATLGFLPFNLHPARIFMGDSGAMFLGFTLSVIAIIGGAKLAAALLVLGIPLLDGVYMIAYRILHGRSPMSADRGHLHHRLLDIGLHQQQVVLIFCLLCGSFGALAFLFTSATRTVSVFGIDVSGSVVKLVGLVLLGLVLVGITVYLARRQFDAAAASPGEDL